MELYLYCFISLKLYIISTQAQILHNIIKGISPGCRLYMCDAPDNHALLIYTNGTGIFYPDIVKELWPIGSNTANTDSSGGPVCSLGNQKDAHFEAIDIPEGESLLAACTGEFEEYKNKLKNFEKTSLTLTCRNDQLMNNDREDNGVILWSELGCLFRPQPDLKGNSGESCGNQQGDLHTIGWQIDNKFFIPQIDICFNKDLETTLYTHHFIHSRYIDAQGNEKGRPSFKQGTLFSLNDVDDLYKKRSQEKLFPQLLGAPDHVAKFLNDKNFLYRGHLSPDADFITEAEQDATYYFANAVPQWSGFNGGNWKALELAIRALAISREQTLSIWSGTHGVLHLPDEQGNNVPIYLGLVENKKLLPVPELMWKIIYDPNEKQSVVLIGLNDISDSDDKIFNRIDSNELDDHSDSSDNNNLWNSLSSAWELGMNTLTDLGVLDSFPLWIGENGITKSSSLNMCQELFAGTDWIKEKNYNTDTKGNMLCCSLKDAKKLIPTLPDLEDEVQQKYNIYI